MRKNRVETWQTKPKIMQPYGGECWQRESAGSKCSTGEDGRGEAWPSAQVKCCVYVVTLFLVTKQLPSYFVIYEN